LTSPNTLELRALGEIAILGETLLHDPPLDLCAFWEGGSALGQARADVLAYECPSIRVRQFDGDSVGEDRKSQLVGEHRRRVGMADGTLELDAAVEHPTAILGESIVGDRTRDSNAVNEDSSGLLLPIQHG
jgi:hypothetical protein